MDRATRLSSAHTELQPTHHRSSYSTSSTHAGLILIRSVLLAGRHRGPLQLRLATDRPLAEGISGNVSLGRAWLVHR